jgi:hypothetical protein
MKHRLRNDAREGCRIASACPKNGLIGTPYLNPAGKVGLVDLERFGGRANSLLFARSRSNGRDWIAKSVRRKDADGAGVR